MERMLCICNPAQEHVRCCKNSARPSVCHCTTEKALEINATICYRGTCLLSEPAKEYGGVSNKRTIKITDKRTGNVQKGFAAGRECLNQNLEQKMMVDKFFEEDRKMLAAFMNFDKTHNRVDREGLWDVLRIYEAGRHILERKFLCVIHI